MNQPETGQEMNTIAAKPSSEIERNIDEEMDEEKTSSEVLTEECVEEIEENKFGLRYSALIRWKDTLSE